MEKTPANPPLKPDRRQTRYVAGVCEQSDVGGMKRPPANQPVIRKRNPSPPPLGPVVERRLLVAAKVITAMSKLIGSITGLMTFLWLAGYIG
jgi:hypothetical protein